jgi:hypothetical protein
VPRTQIIEQAKQIVLSHGPCNCLEFTSELLANDMRGQNPDAYNPDHGPKDDPDWQPLYDEIVKQSIRVYHFLGYQAPFGMDA